MELLELTLSVLPEAKLALPLTARGYWSLRFNAPATPIVKALTVCEAAVTSSAPPLTAKAELAESAPAAPAMSVPPLMVVGPL